MLSVLLNALQSQTECFQQRAHRHNVFLGATRSVVSAKFIFEWMSILVHPCFVFSVVTPEICSNPPPRTLHSALLHGFRCVMSGADVEVYLSQVHDGSVSSGFRALYEERLLLDVTLLIEEHHFQVHKRN